MAEDTNQNDKLVFHQELYNQITTHPVNQSIDNCQSYVPLTEFCESCHHKLF